MLDEEVLATALRANAVADNADGRKEQASHESDMRQLALRCVWNQTREWTSLAVKENLLLHTCTSWSNCAYKHHRTPRNQPSHYTTEDTPFFTSVISHCQQAKEVLLYASFLYFTLQYPWEHRVDALAACVISLIMQQHTVHLRLCRAPSGRLKTLSGSSNRRRILNTEALFS